MAKPGRPKGARNKRTEEAQKIAAEKGVSPLEVMLDNIAWAFEKAQANDDDAPAHRKLANEFAAAAAPYVHPKLANIQHSGDSENPLTLLMNDIGSGQSRLPSSQDKSKL